MRQAERAVRWAGVLGMACLPMTAVGAQDEIEIPAAQGAEPAARAAKAAPRGEITRIRVVPSAGRTEVRIEGRGAFNAKVTKLEDRKWLVLDFADMVYRERRVVLGAPLGDILKVRGGQNAVVPKPVARVVIELGRFVTYTEASTPGAYTLSFETAAVAGPDDADVLGQDVTGVRPVTGAAPAEISSTEAESASTGGIRARVLHAMVNELPDRVRLVITADGILRYKLSSQAEGKELLLTLYDVELKWAPPRLAIKDGPVADVTAKASVKPAPTVAVTVKLRQARPYHVRRDQNQVIIEVDRVAEAEQAAMEEASRKGDLLHKVTLNVQNEDLVSLVKALAFEAGFDNVLVTAGAMGVGRPVTISLRDVSFAKAMNLILAPNDLLWRVEKGIFKVAQEPEFTRELSSAALSGDAGGSGDSEEGGIVTRVFRFRYISVSGVGRGGVSGDSGRIQSIIQNLVVAKSMAQVITDSRSNSLVITDAASNMAKLGRIIRELDTPVPQVMIRARLVQVNTNSGLDFGVNWGLQNARPANPEITARGTSELTSGLQAGTLAVGWLAPGFNLDATLSAMQTKGDLEVILNPSITTMQDQLARVRSSEESSFSNPTVVFPPGGGTVITPNFQAVVNPVELIVTPHINPDKTVVMDVQINITSVTAPRAGGPPDRSVQEARTQLTVRDAETGVIGGMLRSVTSKDVTKIPVLGELPWFLGGALFRKTKEVVTKLELVLFLTPTIAQDI